MTPVTNNAELMSALSAAVGGETIELAAGDYGSLSLNGLTFPSDVTIISADPANPAVASGFYINGASHLVFDGILFDYVVGANPIWAKPFYVYNSAFITIRNSVFDGDEVPSTTGGSGTYGTGFGFWAQSSDNIVIENNEFSKFWKAVSLLYSSNTTFRANNIHTVLSDGLNVISVDGVLIAGNWFHDFKIDPTSGNHPDMIQFWTVLGAPSSRNIIIRDNFLDAGNGDWTQSIFLGTGIAGGGDEDDVYQNILIENNVIYNDHVHGIMVGKADGLVVSNNTLLDDPNVVSPLGWPPRINLDVAALNVTVLDNITGDVWNWSVTVDHPGWIVGNNLLAQNTDPSAENYYGDLFVNPFAAPATLADLRAVAGGVVELGAIGAEMTRADIPMLAGPYATAPTPPPETDTCEADLVAALAALVVAEAERDAALSAQGIAEIEKDTALTALTDAEAALAAMTIERDTAVASVAAMTTLWDEAVAALVVAEAALTAMTIERDAAWLAQSVVEDALVSMTTERDAALLAQAAALTDLASAQAQLAVATAKIEAAQAALA